MLKKEKTETLGGHETVTVGRKEGFNKGHFISGVCVFYKKGFSPGWADSMTQYAKAKALVTKL